MTQVNKNPLSYLKPTNWHKPVIAGLALVAGRSRAEVVSFNTSSGVSGYIGAGYIYGPAVNGEHLGVGGSAQDNLNVLMDSCLPCQDHYQSGNQTVSANAVKLATNPFFALNPPSSNATGQATKSAAMQSCASYYGYVNGAGSYDKWKSNGSWEPSDELVRCAPAGRRK